MELSRLLKQSVEQCLEDEVAVAFSGGLDSSLIAHIAKQYCSVHLFSCGLENSEDIQYARKVSSELSLPLHQNILSESSILELYGEAYSLVPSSMLKVEILIPILSAVKSARENGLDVILFGSGSEELFVGYNRYYTYYEEGKNLDSILKEEYRTLPKRDIAMVSRIARGFSMEPRYPFMNPSLASYVFSIPVEKRMEERVLKKGLLRDAAKLLGLPDVVLKRKKKAAQYGSGVHKILLKHSDFINEHYPPKLELNP